ncbi:MAG TPA: hypothetical protein VND15_04150 [Candidatus Acidoferrales bacterium]|nr:hypothetical protein [Candidatus Acidoferrales bacterium]
MLTNRTIILPILIAAMMLASSAFAAPANSSLSGYLSSYVNGTVINASVYASQSVAGTSYVIMQLNGTGTNYVVIQANPAANYSLVTSSSKAFSVLRPYFVANFKLNKTLVSQLNTSMRQFNAPAQFNITDCLVETGLVGPGATCTIANACSSCQFSPVCRTIMNQAGGVYSPMGFGIVNFSLRYNMLNASYTTYYSSVASLNSGTLGNNIAGIGSSLTAIYNESIALPENPIIAFGKNFDTSLLATCPQSGNPLNMNWYCADAVLGDFCGQMNFNYTAFNVAQNAFNQLSASPITNTSITAISASSAAIANSYVNGVASAEQNETFTAFVANATVKYNSTLANAGVLLKTYPNATLSASIGQLEGIFSSIKSAGPNQNLTEANLTLYSAMQNVSTLYSQMFKIFGPVSSLSYNNTRSIARAQLDYQTVPPRLALLAYMQQRINNELQQGQINSTAATGILAKLNQIGFEAKSFYAPITLPGVTKGLLGVLAPTFVNPNALNSSVNGLPLIFAITTFVIDTIILGFFYLMTYHRLKRERKIRTHRRVSRAWKMLFVALFVIVLVDTGLAYTSSASANAFLPFTGFLSTLHASPIAYVAYNSSSAQNSGTSACVTSIEKTLKAQGKSVYTLTLANYSCAASTNSSQAGTKCYAPILASGQPVILIDNMYGGVAYKGLYGHVFYANSTIASGTGCTLSKVLS